MLRYLKGTTGEGLGYSLGEDLVVWGYSDAGYGSDAETMRGRSGHLYMSGGAALSWGSKIQDVVALSSTEAEYMARTSAMQEGMYLQMMQRELGSSLRREELCFCLIISQQSSWRGTLCSTRGAGILPLSITSLGRSWRARNLPLSLLGL